MPSDTIVDNRLSIPLDLSSALHINTVFLSSAANRGHLAAQLLLYDRIAIPTKDYGILPVLAQWFGPSCFIEALASGSLHFLHKPTMLGYAGNGVGLSTFTIKPPSGRAPEWWQEATFGDGAKAAELQLAHMCPWIGRRERSQLLATVVRYSTEVTMSGSVFDGRIKRETYTDILSSDTLKQQISILCGDPTSIDLERVPSIAPNQMKVSHLDPILDPADMVLRIAETNLALLMGSQMSNSDLYAPAGGDALLAGKLIRARHRPTMIEKFSGLLELTGVPDPAVAVASEEITLSEVWRLRKRRASRRFRHWLCRAAPSDARELERMYVAGLGKTHFVDRLPAKVIRFAITTVAGALHPVPGIIAGVADSFFVDLWLKGYAPKLFLDGLVSIYPKDKESASAREP